MTYFNPALLRKLAAGKGLTKEQVDMLVQKYGLQGQYEMAKKMGLINPDGTMTDEQLQRVVPLSGGKIKSADEVYAMVNGQGNGGGQSGQGNGAGAGAGGDTGDDDEAPPPSASNTNFLGFQKLPGDYGIGNAIGDLTTWFSSQGDASAAASSRCLAYFVPRLVSSAGFALVASALAGRKGGAMVPLLGAIGGFLLGGPLMDMLQGMFGEKPKPPQTRPQPDPNQNQNQNQNQNPSSETPQDTNPSGQGNSEDQAYYPDGTPRGDGKLPQDDIRFLQDVLSDTDGVYSDEQKQKAADTLRQHGIDPNATPQGTIDPEMVQEEEAMREGVPVSQGGTSTANPAGGIGYGKNAGDGKLSPERIAELQDIVDSAVNVDREREFTPQQRAAAERELQSHGIVWTDQGWNNMMPETGPSSGGGTNLEPPPLDAVNGNYGSPEEAFMDQAAKLYAKHTIAWRRNQDPEQWRYNTREYDSLANGIAAEEKRLEEMYYNLSPEQQQKLSSWYDIGRLQNPEQKYGNSPLLPQIEHRIAGVVTALPNESFVGYDRNNPDGQIMRGSEFMRDWDLQKFYTELENKYDKGGQIRHTQGKPLENIIAERNPQYKFHVDPEREGQKAYHMKSVGWRYNGYKEPAHRVDNYVADERNKGTEGPMPTMKPKPLDPDSVPGVVSQTFEGTKPGTPTPGFGPGSRPEDRKLSKKNSADIGKRLGLS